MATRDRTTIFVQKRTELKARSLRRKHITAASEDNSLMRDVDTRDWESARHVLPPIWVDIVDKVNADILEIKEKMDSLSKLHTKRLMITFDGGESEVEFQIEETTQQITSCFRHAEKVLQQMANKKQQGATQADMKTKQNVQRALATQLQSLSLEFRKSQKEYLRRVKNQKQGPSDFEFLSQKPKQSDMATVGLDPGLNQEQLLDVELAEDEISERDEEIKQIASSIEELATIFKELAVLVIDQGTILDRIDYNMEQVIERTEKGIQELEHAEKIQKSSRPMKCIGTLLTLISIMTVILILKSMN